MTLQLGNGQSSASYDLFNTNDLTVDVGGDGRPVNSLANAYDVPPGTQTQLTYTFAAGGPQIYYLGIEGNWFSSSLSNSYSFSISIH